MEITKKTYNEKNGWHKGWDEDPAIIAWKNENGYNDFDTYKYFVLRAHAMAAENNKTVINWEEVYDNFASYLPSNAVIEVIWN